MFKLIPVACDDQDVRVSRYYARYRTAHYWHTVRSEDGMAIMFPSKQEAMRAARTEWWRHVNGDPATNRSIKLQEARLGK